MCKDILQAIDAVNVLHSRLVLLVGVPPEGKVTLLNQLELELGLTTFRLGAEVGIRLAQVPRKQRPLQANTIFRELADVHAKQGKVLIDNIELLFDNSLQLNPLDLLKRQAQVRTVVAVWPGLFKEGRLTYAPIGHPEHQDYAADGLVVCPIN